LVYSWFILHKSDAGLSPIFWWIGPCVVSLCGISCTVNVIEMRRIGRYLARIEESAFGLENPNLPLPGWEREQQNPRQRGMVTAHMSVSLVVWVLVFLATILASYTLSHISN
jgi:hypothetical protein